MPRKWYDGKLICIESMSPTVKRFIIKVEEVEAFEFKAGQFITCDLPISEKRLKRWRSYSIANEPDGSNVIELCIVHLEGGLGSTYFFDEVKVGMTLKFKGPAGAFYLPKEIQNDLVMICTGTGVAPFRSMIKDLKKRKVAFSNIHLIFGARQVEDILYREEFESIASENPEISYDVCLSRDVEWTGYRGYVHQVYMEHEYKEGTKFYLCGWSQMIDEAVEKLLSEKQIEKKDIIYELYG